MGCTKTKSGGLAVKKFNGVPYTRMAIVDNKRSAKEIALNVRGGGDFARVWRAPNGKYSVYMKGAEYYRR